MTIQSKVSSPTMFPSVFKIWRKERPSPSIWCVNYYWN